MSEKSERFTSVPRNHRKKGKRTNSKPMQTLEDSGLFELSRFPGTRKVERKRVQKSYMPTQRSKILRAKQLGQFILLALDALILLKSSNKSYSLSLRHQKANYSPAYACHLWYRIRREEENCAEFTQDTAEKHSLRMIVNVVLEEQCGLQNVFLNM